MTKPDLHISKCALNNFKTKAHALTNVPLKPGVQASTLSYPALIAAPSLTYEQEHTLYHARRSLSFIILRVIFLFTDKIKKFPQINITILLLSKIMIHIRVYRNTYLFRIWILVRTIEQHPCSRFTLLTV